MHVDFLLDAFRADPGREAIVRRDAAVTYGWLAAEVARWRDRLATERIAPGAVTALEADFSPTAVALLLALVERGSIVVPVSPVVGERKAEFFDIAQVEVHIAVDGADRAEIRFTGRAADHRLFGELRRRRRPGLVLFSSGSTGRSKAAVHDFTGLLDKFRTPRHRKRIITFLLFDHIGGVNTLLYTLSNTGCVIALEDRSPESVCAAIARHRAEVLPTSPTFLNLLLLSEAWRRHDLSSLELVTYGTEVMPESTLRRLREALPWVRLQQTYGLSELGILRSKSRSSDSLWVKVGGEGFETRIVDGKLEIRARSAMLGYLNAPSPFTEDGWFRTGDVVEQDGEYIRILGRASEIINVGGEKVYPAQVESVLQLMDGVEDVAVEGAPNAITGQAVVARVKLCTGETRGEFVRRMRRFCRGRLGEAQIPQRVVLLDSPTYGGRFKRMRGG